MPTLHWIGKDAVRDHHRQVPYHLLRCDEKLSVGDPGSGNLLVQGDNLLALKALLPYYAGQVKCIYIDPPYNTGDEDWLYNDAVNSPEIRKWLGKAVGKEAEDLCRHDKWLSMMYPRISLLREFLRSDGVIFVSIDEHEYGNLHALMDEVFGISNRLGTLVWKRRSSSAMRGTPLSVDHEYIFCYAREAGKATLYGLSKSVEDYPYEDSRGRYASTDLTIGATKEARPGQFYPITNPRTGKVYQPNPERVWRFWPETMKKVIEQNLIIWPDEVGGRMERPRFKTYYDPNTEKPKPISTWIESPNTNDRELAQDEAEYETTILSTGMTQEGGRLLLHMLGRKVFAYPKPLSLIRSLLRATTRGQDIVLDSFAGTATTGHAVLQLNREDGQRRRFILVEMDAQISREITAERLRRAVLGYEYVNQKGGKTAVEGLGGGYRYCTLAEPLFDELGTIRPEVEFAELAAHVFFTETGEPLTMRCNKPRARRGDRSSPGNAGGLSPLIGVCKGTAYYLLFNGVLGDKRPDGGNVLTSKTLAQFPPHEGPKVVYGEGCRLGAARLKRENIVFKQVPYEVKVT
jgi:site-specific DNA-methyltransferase (adenine-specific)/adenine-specific DNA-methyltransferase